MVAVTVLQQEIMDLSGAGLTEIPKTVFNNPPQVLNLHRNRLITLPPEVAGLKRLEVLILSENELATVPEEFGELTSLRTLDLGHNRLRGLPRSFSKLKGLRDYLYLHDNRLHALDKGIFEGFVDLLYLNLSGNQGLTPPDSIADLKSLEELRLEKMGLTAIPAWIGDLASLEELSVRDNELESLPGSFAELKRLRRLDLRGNQIRSLPEALRGLPNLTKLDLRWNRLESEPVWLGKLRERGCRVLL